MAKYKIKSFSRHVIEKSAEDNIGGEAAGLAFYMIFALIPLLILLFSIFGIFVTEVSLKNGIVQYFGERIGPTGAEFFTRILNGISDIEINTFASLIGLFIILIAATNLFRHVQKTFARIFHNTRAEEKHFLKKTLEDRIVAGSFMIILFSLMFLVVIANISLSLFLGNVSQYFHTPFLIFFFGGARHIATFIITIIVFSTIYHITSISKLSWKDSFFGGVVAAVTFTLVNIFLSLYLSFSDNFTAYGTAGFFIAFLLWFYFVSISLFLGAEVSKVNHKHFSR